MAIKGTDLEARLRAWTWSRLPLWICG